MARNSLHISIFKRQGLKVRYVDFNYRNDNCVYSVKKITRVLNIVPINISDSEDSKICSYLYYFLFIISLKVIKEHL